MKKQTMRVEELEFTLVQKPMKSIRLTVKPPNADVVVSAPYSLPIKQIHLFVSQRMDWIRRARQSVRARNPHMNFGDGQKIVWFGKDYLLKTVVGKRTKFSVGENNIFLTKKQDAGYEELEQSFLKFCKKNLQQVLPQYFSKWSKVTGLEVKGFSVRDMKTRWGSCNYKKQTISINVRVVQKPIECLDYLVLHEVAHIKEPSHNKNFKAFLSCYMPDWRLWQKTLKK